MRAALYTSLLLFAGAGCADGRAVVEVTVSAIEAVEPVDRFDARVTTTRAVSSFAIVPAARPTTIPPSATFSLTFEASREGPLAVSLDALDASGKVVGVGSGTGEISPSQKTIVLVDLHPTL